MGWGFGFGVVLVMGLKILFRCFLKLVFSAMTMLSIPVELYQLAFLNVKYNPLSLITGFQVGLIKLLSFQPSIEVWDRFGSGLWVRD